MGAAKPRPPNQLLASLRDSDLALLWPHLTPLLLPVRKVLARPGGIIRQVTFINSGIASVVAVSATRTKRVEVGLIGREGFTGVEVIFDNNRAAHEVFMQVGGAGASMPVTELRKAIAASATLQRQLLRYANAFMVQTAHTALANGSATIEERLARWLLMAQDRLDVAGLPITHEFLALMLGVRRAGVTVAVQSLEDDGLIRGGRGTIRIVDREALTDKAGGIYGCAEEEYRRLIGNLPEGGA